MKSNLGHPTFPPSDRLLPTWPTWKGLAALSALSLVWPFILSTGSWIGWDWRTALTLGAGGVAQELFFRAALLPALLALLPGKQALAIVLHAFLFAIWHAGAFLVAPPGMIAGPVAIVSLSLVAGMIWGWQTMHDGRRCGPHSTMPCCG